MRYLVLSMKHARLFHRHHQPPPPTPTTTRTNNNNSNVAVIFRLVHRRLFPLAQTPPETFNLLPDCFMELESCPLDETSCSGGGGGGYGDDDGDDRDDDDGDDDTAVCPSEMSDCQVPKYCRSDSDRHAEIRFYDGEFRKGKHVLKHARASEEIQNVQKGADKTDKALGPR